MPNENRKDQYKSLISEVIAKQAIILGPDIAVLKARNVGGLKVDDSGKVTDIKGDAGKIMQNLVDEYVNLSGMIVKNALGSVFSKYPSLNKQGDN